MLFDELLKLLHGVAVAQKLEYASRVDLGLAWAGWTYTTPL